MSKGPSSRDDWRSVGLLFLETAILSLTENDNPDAQAFIERLAVEIFPDDFDGLRCRFGLSLSAAECREYCMNEPSWAEPVAFLSEREDAGWELLQQLLQGSGSIALQRRFLND